MTPYRIVLASHVIVAILGLGSATALVVLAGAARRASRRLPELASWLAPFDRIISVSLGLMLVTGFGLDWMRDGIPHRTWWFRISLVIFLAIGALHGRLRRVLRAQPSADADGIAMAHVERVGWAICGLVAVLAFLMEAKPF